MDKDTHVYCNGNRPFGKLTTLTRYIHVSYTARQLQSAVDTVFPEGFRLAYKAIPKVESFQEYYTETNGIILKLFEHLNIKLYEMALR